MIRVSGLWFEQLEPGLRVEHATTRTVTETDNVLFTTMTMNPQPLHLDAAFAATTEFGRPLVNSLFTLGLVVGLAVPELTLGTTVANLGFSRVDFPAPVFTGDTDPRGNRRRRGPPVAVPARHRDRHVRASRHQPARGDGLRRRARGDDAVPPGTRARCGASGPGRPSGPGARARAGAGLSVPCRS